MTEKLKTVQDARDSLEAVQGYLLEQASQLSQYRQQRDLQPFSDVGEVIREARKRQKLTIEDLVLYSNVSKVTIGKIENGDTSVTVPKLQAVLGALGLSLWVG